MTGTVHTNRVPRCSIHKAEKDLRAHRQRSFDFKTDDKNITIVRWLDNKIVTVISTFFGVNPVTHVKRLSGSSKAKIYIPRPNNIYNKGMGDIDLMDMLMELYRVKIRKKRGYLRVISHLLDICIVNAWINNMTTRDI